MTLVNHQQETAAQQFMQRLEQLYQHAEKQLKRSFPRPEVNFKLRGRSAGTAHLQSNKLRFNAVLFTENQQAFFDEVLPHEICHLLCYQLYGRVRPHGKEWQQLMLKLFNVVPKTTHNFDVVSVQAQSFNYQCHCGIVPLSIRRHNKIIRGQTQYRCRRCGERLMATTS